ncbi:MAG: malectin, partial [Bacteroidota bacterium]
LGQDIWLEAECATVGENLEVLENENASRSQAILMRGDAQINAPSNDPKDRIVFEINVAEGGTYNMFGRVAAQDATANSFWVKANGGNWINWDNIAQNSFQGNVGSATRASKVPIIPGYTSFAMDSKGGRGGKVIKVTNLKDSGSGSLRACIESDGARVCAFETSGVINLKSELKISNPYITIAGQTAPDPGIILYGNMLVIRSHDVLIQHLGIRSGDINFGGNHEKNSKDCISIRKGSTKIVLDHLSLAWGTDENMDISGNVGEICLRNVLFSNALNKNGHAFGALFYDKGSLAIEGSMFANLDQRQPMSRIEKLILVNNLHYNRGLRFAQFSSSSSTRNKTLNSLVGNVYVEGPSRRNNAKPILLHRGDIKSGTKMYLKDNYWKSNINASGKLSDQWSLVQDQGGNANPKTSKPPVWVNGMKVLTEEDQIIDYVLQSVGPRPAKRNYLDKKVIDNYKAGKGGIIDCVKGCRNNDGGLPKLARNQRKLNIPSNPSGDNDGDGYTNLEEWLHQMAAQVEGKPYDPGDEPEDQTPGLGETFSWHKLTDSEKQNQVVRLNLLEGKNTIEIARKEAGIILDKIYLSKDNDTPSGAGGEANNCDDFSGPGLSSIRINAGGVKMNTSGKEFRADTYYTESSSTGVYNSSIDGTPDEGLYKTERIGNAFGYRIPIENGEYDIRLRFAELKWLESGKRRFDISMEGTNMIRDFDIFAESNFGVAVDKEFLAVQVQDGMLNIDLAASIGEAQICAIEVLPAGSLSNSSNTPPTFATSGDLILVQDFEGVEYVEVSPAAIPAAEASQEVIYSLSPAFSLISNISINSSTGLVEVKALEGIAGSEEFTIIANDGQEKNNVYTQTFKLVILSDEPSTIKGGGSIIRINAGG